MSGAGSNMALVRDAPRAGGSIQAVCSGAPHNSTLGRGDQGTANQ